ncbi:unknown [Prevotella sp. CAG:386]|nr:unknown [Prevotella sp. CAG:386]
MTEKEMYDRINGTQTRSSIKTKPGRLLRPTSAIYEA